MSNLDLVQYIVEQASQAGEVTAKKMFGATNGCNLLTMEPNRTMSFPTWMTETMCPYWLKLLLKV